MTEEVKMHRWIFQRPESKPIPGLSIPPQQENGMTYHRKHRWHLATMLLRAEYRREVKRPTPYIT
jgi:hypothetical protein